MGQRAQEQQRPPVLALVAHDGKKEALTQFCAQNRKALADWSLIGTGSTAEQIAEATGLPVEGLLSGPEGGDAQIAARVAVGEVGAVLFIVDPLSAHPHDPDIQSLQRICNVHDVPIATNLATAALIVQPRTIEETVAA